MIFSHMTLATTRLDKFIASTCKVSRKNVRILLAQHKIKVDDEIVTDMDLIINRFTKVELDGELLQNHQAHYVMLHKPVGVVCATKDSKHKTIIDLLPYTYKHDLHIVGRLDLNTSGLVLLTNDSRWSKMLTHPTNKVNKHYQVTLKNPITTDYIKVFNQGMYFEYENITTKPAQLMINSPYQAEVWLTEGRYHQIKRMFGRFRNQVIALHRVSIGEIKLDDKLMVGQSRILSPTEINAVKVNSTS